MSAGSAETEADGNAEMLPRTLDGFPVHPDDRLTSLSEFIGELAAAVTAEPQDGEAWLTLAELSVGLPFELDLLEVDGRIVLDAAPPTQHTETTVMPVLHQLTLRIEADHGDSGLES